MEGIRLFKLRRHHYIYSVGLPYCGTAIFVYLWCLLTSDLCVQLGVGWQGDGNDVLIHVQMK